MPISHLEPYAQRLGHTLDKRHTHALCDGFANAERHRLGLPNADGVCDTEHDCKRELDTSCDGLHDGDCNLHAIAHVHPVAFRHAVGFTHPDGYKHSVVHGN